MSNELLNVQAMSPENNLYFPRIDRNWKGYFSYPQVIKIDCTLIVWTCKYLLSEFLFIFYLLQSLWKVC